MSSPNKPSRRLCACAWSLLLCLPWVQRAGAQEASISSGALDTDDHSNATYTWQLQYQQRFTPHLAASLAWLNEGHLLDHRRDGTAMQVWLQSSAWRQAWRFSLGAGPYFYFDTEPDSDRRGYIDRHAVAAAVSASIALETRSPWTWHLTLNQIQAPGDIGTRSLTFGVGYRFGALTPELHASDAPSALEAPRYRQQLQLFGGESTLNSLTVHDSPTFGLDYQASVSNWLAGAVTWFHATYWVHTPPNRAAVQVRVEHRIDDTPLTLSAGVGAYATLGGVSGDPAAETQTVSGILLVRSSWRFSARLELVANWFRTFTHDDHDLDIITFGAAWRFGR